MSQFCEPKKNSSLETAWSPSTRVTKSLKVAVISCSLLLSGSSLEQSSIHSATNLEEKIWLAGQESEIWSIEKQATLRVQLSATESYNFYLLSLVHLRLFLSDPSDLGKLRSATELAQQAIDLAPEQEHGYIALANILDASGHSKTAVKIIRSLSDRADKISWRSAFTIARIDAENISNKDVLALLDSSIINCTHQGNIVAPYIVAVLSTMFKSPNLEQQIEQRNSECPSHIYLESLGNLAERKGKWKKARDFYSTVSNKAPLNKMVRISLARILHTKFGLTKSAHQILDAVVTASEKSNDHQAWSDSLIEKGKIQLSLGQFSAANDYYLLAARKALVQDDVLSRVSHIYREQEKYKALQDFYTTWAKELKGSSTLYALHGELMANELNKPKHSIQLFNKAILLEPSRSQLHNSLGLALYKLDHLESALKSFQNARNHSPTDSIAYYNEACVLVRLGRVDEALPQLQEALNLNPSLADSASKDMDFKTIKSMPKFKLIISEANMIPSEEELSH
jgi:tetratricopeptide (TPR) repeat protein